MCIEDVMELKCFTVFLAHAQHHEEELSIFDSVGKTKRQIT